MCGIYYISIIWEIISIISSNIDFLWFVSITLLWNSIEIKIWTSDLFSMLLNILWHFLESTHFFSL